MSDVIQLTNRRLLAVFAHPDDETFGVGGTLALCARQGVDVYLVCATRGEVGEAPTGLNGFSSIGEMRENELRHAASVLGLKQVDFLGYRDSGMPGSPDNHHPNALVAAPVEHVARQVAGYIRRIRPQVVITFDPVGGYYHPDHIAIHRATVKAFGIAQDLDQDIDHLPPHIPQKLYYLTFSRRILRWAVRILQFVGRDPHRFGHNQDIDLTLLAENEFRIDASIPISTMMQVKEQAAACHSSQGGGIGLPFKWLQRWIARRETFMRAIPKTAPEHLERDLFEGTESEPQLQSRGNRV